MNWLIILGFILAFLGLAVLVVPGLGWWNNPELTHMQLFHEYWMYFVTAIICFFTARLIGIYYQHKRANNEKSTLHP